MWMRPNLALQILAGDFLALDEGFVAANEANNETGQLSYALTLLAPAEPASGSGTLVEFEVEALETGSIDLLLRFGNLGFARRRTAAGTTTKTIQEMTWHCCTNGNGDGNSTAHGSGNRGFAGHGRQRPKTS